MRGSLVVFIALSLWGDPSMCAPQVRIGQTTIIGRDIQPLGQEFFGNIPFAEPPLGPLRLAPPVPKFTPSGSTLNGSDFGLSCPQALFPVFSEDCLTINVLRPSGLSSNARLPIMAWVYGGGFYQGSATIYNGSAIVAQSVERGTPVIFVSFNYRLGALGFPQGSEVVRRGATNLGLKDQLVALQWVQRNIAIFGGDKSKVTVFGESTGSVALNQHFLSPSFSQVARAGIFQSGSASSAFIFDGNRREQIWTDFVSQVPECNGARPGQTFNCLRMANTTTLLAASEYARSVAPEQFPFWSVIDGPGGLIPDLPSKLWSQGKFARLPFIAGTCLDEGTIFTPPTFDSTQLLHQWIIANATPSDFASSELNRVADKLLQLYPDIPSLGSPYNTGNETFGLSPQYKRAASFVGDHGLHSLRRLWMQQSSRFGVKAFGYSFSDPQPIGPVFLNFANYTGVYHSSDVPYVFGGLVNATAASASLSLNMIDYWISFSTSLTPNDNHGNTSRARWTQFTPQNQVVINLNGDDLKNIPDTFRAEQIGFINDPKNALILRH